MKTAKKTPAKNADQEFDPEDLALEMTIQQVCKLLGIETLNARNSDRLDFHTLSVGQIQMVVRKAFAAGITFAKA